MLDDNTTNQTATETETTSHNGDAASPTSTDSNAQAAAASLPDVGNAAAPQPAAPEAEAQAQASVQPAPVPPVQPAAAAEAEKSSGSAANVEDFATALENYETEAAEAEASEDRVLQGTVVKITPTHVVVDIGAKSEGMVPIEEVRDHEGNVSFQQGDSIPVLVERGETEEGYTRLSYQKAARIKAWEEIESAYNNKTAIKGKVVDRVKGGLSVDILGARAFLPGSQVDVRPVRNLDGYKGQDLEVHIIKLNRKRGNIVVSRKQLLEEATAEKRGKTLEKLHEDSVLTGTVKNLTQYGAFVDLGGIDGLLHITDMSWGRLTHPRDLVNVGDEIQVKVLKYDPEKQRVSLGFKQLTPDPWTDAAHRYPVGAHVKGRVISCTDYGAFIELEQGIEGLVHVSEMTWSKRMKHPSKLVAIGQQVEAVVLNVNPNDRRISLGLKQLESNPWETLHEKYPVGSTVEGRVRNLTDFGAFIEIEDGIDGLVHVSNMSWTKRVKHPSEVLKKGDKVKAQVLAIEPEHRRLSLGLKQLEPDVWEKFFQQHRVGDVLHGKVLRVAGFGAFVEIAEGIEGLCHNSEAADAEGHAIKLEPGQEFDFKIIKLNEPEHKVGLSLRAVGEEASRQEVESYKHPASSATTTLGDLVTWKRASNEER